MELQRGGIKRGGKAAGGILIDIGLLVLGCFLFAGSFPNPLVINGIPILAWFAFIPIFLLLMRIPLWASPIYGGVYGYLSFTLFNYWLGAFHPLAGIIVGLIYFVWNLISFFAMSLALKFFPKKGYLILPFIWLAYEYLRIQGFLGYPYGIIGYSQWEFLPLIQVASVFGVWAVSLLVVFPQAVIAHLIKAHAEARRNGNDWYQNPRVPRGPA
ncbi:MAG: hypothetical protein LBM77_04130 [Spirochaetaceae bacterium]|nr:hypothetical protein [Spirochaetaceae bacterium]